MNTNTEVANFVQLVQEVIGSEPAQLHEPSFGNKEKELVSHCIDSGFVSSVGSFVTDFESAIKEFTGSKHAIAVSSGTAALHVGLMLVGVMPDDEVIVPTSSFVATANAVMHAGANPFFVDSETKSLGMDPFALERVLRKLSRRGNTWVNSETGRRVAAIVPMHTFGHPTQIREIERIANDYEIPIVEDSAESLGSFVGETHTGTIGKVGVLSFNGNKIITTGGGGAILTQDDVLAERARSLTTTAKRPHAWEFYHSSVAWNYRMPNINAALGLAQVLRLPEYISKKRSLAQKYISVFSKSSGASFNIEPDGTLSNYWLCSVTLNEENDDLLRSILLSLAESGLNARPLWDPLHTLPMYRNSPRGDLSTSMSLRKRVISLPSSPFLSDRLGSLSTNFGARNA